MVEKVYIYALCEPDTSEIRYIGKTKNLQRRFRGHLSDSVRLKNYKLYSWIAGLREHGKRPLMIVIEEVSEEDWRDRERFHIKESRDKFGDRILNVLDGGNCVAFTEEIRNKMRLAAKNRPPSTPKGFKHTEESRAHMSVGQKKRTIWPTPKHTEQSKGRLRARTIEYFRKRDHLTENDVRNIRDLMCNYQYAAKAISEEFSIPLHKAGGIKRGTVYRWIKNEDGTEYIPPPAEKGKRRTLSDETVRKIRNLCLDGTADLNSIAQKFGVGYNIIYHIVRGKIYRSVKNADGTDYCPPDNVYHKGVAWRISSEVKRDREMGTSYKQISSKFGISPQTIWRILNSDEQS